MQDIAWPEREFDLLLESVSFESEDAADADANADSIADFIPSTRALGPFDALAPLVTDVAGAQEAASSRPETDHSRDAVLRAGEVRRHALLRAIADLAETHAVAADLACRQAAIDLPLDVPDPVFHAFDESIALTGATPKSETMLIVPDVIRACRDRLAAYTDAADRLKLDTVATLFDHVLADDRLPTGIRNTLARLQLPVLRMALADESFFASRTHPTRRLLDRLAASAADWKLGSDSGRAWRAELERVVHAVIRGSSEDAGEHARLLEIFESRLIEIAATATPALALVPDLEDRDVLVIKATIQISQLLAGLEVDRDIRFFLLDVWSRVLAEIVWASPASEKGGGRDGACDVARDATLARAKRLCGDLAWSAAPKRTSGERARLAGLLPTMIEALRDGLAMIDYPRAEQDRFFAEWARMLYVAVRRPHDAGDFNRPFRLAGNNGARDVRDAPEALDIDDFARRLREGSFGPEMLHGTDPTEAASATLTTDTVLESKRLGLRSAGDSTPSILSGVPRETSEAALATSVPVIADLHKGEWFELREPRGFVRVRLSWISPLRSFYLFIGADSALTRSFDPSVLEELLSRGNLRRLAVDGERRA